MAEIRLKQKHSYRTKTWQVMFSFLFFGFPQSVSGQLSYSIFEEIKIGSLIGNIANDLGLNVKDLPFRNLHIAHGTTEQYFTVNLEDGILYVSQRLDRERLCGATNPCILTFEAVVENPLNVFHAQVTIQDINDNPPTFFQEIIELDIIESTLPGARFMLQNARDVDVGINSIQNYKLSDNNYFRLGEKISPDGTKLPEMVLEKPLDREMQSSYDLILIASDGGNPIVTGTALIKVIVNDANDNFPIFTQELYKISLNENTPINSLVLYLSASDKDEGSNAHITYSFTNVPENALHVFSIDSNSGEIKTEQNLDFEVAKSYELSVQAKDGGGKVAHSKIIIQVTDINDNAPEIIFTSISSALAEDSLPGTVIALINVRDRDSGENSEIDCQITDMLPFKLISFSGSYYKIITTGIMDREKISLYNITVVASDIGSPPLSTRKTIRLEILDVNDNPPVFDKMAYVVYVPENNLPGASIYNIHASDLDIDNNARIIYKIVNPSIEEIPVSSQFSINPVTGVLYAQRSFDYEQHREFQILIMAKDSGSPPLNSNATLKICVVDQNDNAPNILYPSPETEVSTLFEMVLFASEQGSLVTKVVAVDVDSGHNAWLSYHFVQVPETSHFIIGCHTGEIRTSRVFQEKDALRHRVVVMVKDNGSPSLSATVTLNLIVAEHFQQMLPEVNNQPRKSGDQSSLQIYLVIALGLISFLFILTVMLAIISKCKKTKPATFSSLNANIYSQGDPRFLSKYNNETLPLPYSYNVCVALESSESDFAFFKPNQNVPVASLIDADDSGIRSENTKETLPTSNFIEAPITHDLKNVIGRFCETE
ncbi:hypothetical protein FKM82_011955 [Ascaphus truei]